VVRAPAPSLCRAPCEWLMVLRLVFNRPLLSTIAANQLQLECTHAIIKVHLCGRREAGPPGG
jgi:hypothetical protein